MSERAVEKHVGSVFQKLGLVTESDVNRRVMAVLAYLEATGAPRQRTLRQVWVAPLCPGSRARDHEGRGGVQ